MTKTKPLTPLLKRRLYVFLVCFFLLVSALIVVFYIMDQWKHHIKEKLTELRHLGHEITYTTFSTSFEFDHLLPGIRFHLENVVLEKKPDFRVEAPSLDVRFSILNPTSTHIQFSQASLETLSLPYKITLRDGLGFFNNSKLVFSTTFGAIDIHQNQVPLISLHNISCQTKETSFSYAQMSPQGKEVTATHPALALTIKAEGLAIPFLQTANLTPPFTQLHLNLMVIEPEILRNGLSAPAESLMKWRDANGFIEVTHYSLNWDEIQASGDGTVALDDLLRIEGAGGLSVTHLSELLNKLATMNALRTQDTILLNLGLGLMNTQNHIFLPLTLQGGVLSIGSFIKLDVPLGFFLN